MDYKVIPHLPGENRLPTASLWEKWLECRERVSIKTLSDFRFSKEYSNQLFV